MSRSNKRRWHDKFTLGRPALAKYHPNPLQRHENRLLTANATQRAAQAFCISRKVKLKVANHGEHWKFAKNGTVAELWPSTAKLVLQQFWRQSIHCHDWFQLESVLNVIFPTVGEVEIVR